ncbi:MAG: hypothetical protein HY588_01360 [Candidatus Omnitrophica bacterium]|nr:hypothetical protein [Candidatus Omnitrophota bacterium]
MKPLEGEAPPFHFGSYVMAPWSNRVVQGVFEFEGERYRLRKNFFDDTAIHGDVRNRSWEVRKATLEAFEAVLDSRRFQDFNFPFRLVFQHKLELHDSRLLMSLVIENVDQRPAPVGMGFHPFFKRRLTNRDQDVVVLLAANQVYPDEKCIPTGPAVAVGGKTDLRSKRFLGNPNLDHCFTGLTNQVVRLLYLGSDREVQIKMDPIFTHVVVYAPNDLYGRAKDFVAVEPVTHVNNGFNFLARGWQGTGVKILKPREKWEGICELSVTNLSGR